ncbi:hypothetical protein A2U01_0063454, partial [Trifolium medium]|nr:hypothetical protein [Trifolium medium]
CGETFDTKKGLEDHMKTHNGPFKCFKCNRIYSTRIGRLEHMKNGHCSKK